MRTIRAKKEGLVPLIAEAKGWDYVTVGYYGDPSQTEWQIDNRDFMDRYDMRHVGDYIIKDYESGEWILAEDFQPHTDGNQALQLLCEIMNKTHTALGVGGMVFFNKEADRADTIKHEQTPESICQAICLSWLAGHGINVELED